MREQGGGRHREHLLAGRGGRRHHPHRLQGVQGRRQRADPDAGHRLRPRRHPGQRHHARASSTRPMGVDAAARAVGRSRQELADGPGPTRAARPPGHGLGRGPRRACSWPPTRPPSSPAWCCPSTAARPPWSVDAKLGEGRAQRPGQLQGPAWAGRAGPGGRRARPARRARPGCPAPGGPSTEPVGRRRISSAPGAGTSATKSSDQSRWVVARDPGPPAWTSSSCQRRATRAHSGRSRPPTSRVTAAQASSGSPAQVVASRRADVVDVGHQLDRRATGARGRSRRRDRRSRRGTGRSPGRVPRPRPCGRGCRRCGPHG